MNKMFSFVLLSSIMLAYTPLMANSKPEKKELDVSYSGPFSHIKNPFLRYELQKRAEELERQEQQKRVSKKAREHKELGKLDIKELRSIMQKYA